MSLWLCLSERDERLSELGVRERGERDCQYICPQCRAYTAYRAKKFRISELRDWVLLNILN